MNIATDEELKKEYDKLYKKFVTGNYPEVIKECNKVISPFFPDISPESFNSLRNSFEPLISN